LLLFAALGYLQCLKNGDCHSDEVYDVIGQPGILDILRKAGVSETIVQVINGLDEPGWCPCPENMADGWFERAIDELVQECLRLLKELGPPSFKTRPPTWRLFVNADHGR